MNLKTSVAVLSVNIYLHCMHGSCHDLCNAVCYGNVLEGLYNIAFNFYTAIPFAVLSSVLLLMC